MPTEIIVALIGAAVSLLLGFMEFMRRQNNRDHAENSNKLDRVLDKIDHVDSRLSSHIEWHAHKKSRAS